MRVGRSFIRNLELYIHPELKSQFVRVVTPFDEVSSEALKRVGLDEPLEEGESFLPPPVGRVSRVNSEGRWIVHRDRPKEPR